MDMLTLELLRYSGFDRRTFNYLMKPKLTIRFRGRDISVVPDLVLQQRGGAFRRCFVEESKKATNASTSEPQVVAETIAVALDNWRAHSGDQTVYAVRVRGTKLRFYRATFYSEYLSTLAKSTAPKGIANFMRFPANMGVSEGLDLLDNQQRHTALLYLASLRKVLQPTPPTSPST